MTGDLFPETIPVDDDNDQRFTTRETIEWCKRRSGVDEYDLDVAACVESHWAQVWYGQREDHFADGLSNPWFGHVWCNPPFSKIEPWVKKAWAAWSGQFERPKSISMLLPAVRTEQAWWQTWVEPFRDGHDVYGEGKPLIAMDAGPVALTTHFLPGRTAFAKPGSGGVGQEGSPFGCVLLLWRRDG